MKRNATQKDIRDVPVDMRLPSGNRYLIERTIHRTAETVVCLARHRNLKEMRVIKRIKKQKPGGIDNYCGREAEILMGLRHPGIPILYDMEEDDSYYYLIEEYVRGMPLSDYLNWRNTISLEQICSFMVQLCQIIEYLNNRKPIPILYQDLKPDHLYVCNDRLMLIDYGAALFAPRSGTTFQKYGTPGFLAPETVSSGIVNVKTVIYSIGCIADELFFHAQEAVPRDMRRLVSRSLSRNPALRPGNICDYRKSWEKILRSLASDRLFCAGLRFAVAGIERSCGTTHVALSLAVFLNSKGQKAYYTENKNGSVTNRLAEECPAFYERDLIIYHYRFRALMNTGDAVIPPEIQAGACCVLDAGVLNAETDRKGFYDADIRIIVVGGRPWQERRIDTESIPEDAVFLINPANSHAGRRFALESGRKVMGFPFDADPFTMTRQKTRLFQKITGS